MPTAIPLATLAGLVAGAVVSIITRMGMADVVVASPHAVLGQPIPRTITTQGGSHLQGDVGLWALPDTEGGERRAALCGASGSSTKPADGRCQT